MARLSRKARGEESSHTIALSAKPLAFQKASSRDWMRIESSQ